MIAECLLGAREIRSESRIQAGEESARTRSPFRCDADQHSAVSPITVPGRSRTQFRWEADHFSADGRNGDRLGAECFPQATEPGGAGQQYGK